jgi:hypothetical protein
MQPKTKIKELITAWENEDSAVYALARRTLAVLAAYPQVPPKILTTLQHMASGYTDDMDIYGVVRYLRGRL